MFGHVVGAAPGHRRVALACSVVGSLAGTLLGSFTGVAAGRPVPEARETPVVWAQPGWWLLPSEPLVGNNAAWAYTYPDYDLNCAPAWTAESAIRMIWVEPDTATHHLLARSLPWLHEGIRRAASIYGASMRQVFTPTTKYADHSPRFITRQAVDGSCHAQFLTVTVPTQVLRLDPEDPGGLVAYLEARGFDRWNRKYYALVQAYAPESWAREGIEGATIINDPNHSQPADASNPNNVGGSWSLDYLGNHASAWFASTDDNGGFLAYNVAHEIAHSLGAVLPGAPHLRTVPYADGHAADCNDLMASCDSANRPVLGQFLACTSQRATMRLDCHRDDYFNPTHPAWEAERWNIANSSFLWGGGPQPPAASRVR